MTTPNAPAFRPLSRAGASFAVMVAMGVAGWVAACTDEAEPGIGPMADAAPDTSVVLDAATDAGAALDCDHDLDGSGLWRRLECTGLYSSIGDKSIAADVKPYKPGVEFWSDGAEKQRFVYLPPGTAIDISNFDEWKFPVGTKLWKEFKVGGKRIETRLFTKAPDGSWLHASYRWNDDESAAVIGGGEKIPGIGLDGGPYEIPNPGQCDQCHHGKDDQILGFEAVSLGLPSATGETLAQLAADGRLSSPPPATSFDFPGSDTARPAVGWIHANCGACHTANPNGVANQKSHFRVRATELAPTDGGPPAELEDLDVWTQGYCVDTFRTEPGGSPYKYIRGGDAERSLVYVLANHRVPWDQIPTPGAQMPPLVTRAVDQEGVAKVRAWIESLPPCAE